MTFFTHNYFIDNSQIFDYRCFPSTHPFSKLCISGQATTEAASYPSRH
uniref:Uncharacterized protein n=1 Tax=Anguilla anguilla TaxID=7936 RepID=A0A0E9VVG6_ANGAN